MSVTQAPRRSATTLLQRIRECNRAAIARTGDIDILAVVVVLRAVLDDPGSCEGALLEIASFIASHLDDGLPTR